MARDFLSSNPNTTNPFGRVPRRRKPRLKEGRRDEAAAWWQPTRLRAWLGARDWSRVSLLVATILLLSALLSLHLLPDKVSLRPGDISGQDIRALRTVRYLDEDATEMLRAAAAARVEPVYNSVHAASEADETITEAYLRLRNAQTLGARDPKRVAREMYAQVGLTLAPHDLAPVLSAGAGAYHLDQAERLTHQAVHDVMARETSRRPSKRIGSGP